jgi:heptosyltransferase-2
MNIIIKKLLYGQFLIFIALKRFLLSILKIALFFRNAPSEFFPDTVVVLKVGGLGDFTFGIPALNLLRDRLPNSRICLVTAKSLSGLNFKFSGRNPLDTSELPWASFVRSSVDDIIVVHDLSFKMIGKISELIPKSKNTSIFILGYPGMTISSALKKMIFIRFFVKSYVVCLGVDKKLDDRFMRKFQSQQGLYRHKMLGDIDSVMEAFPHQSFSDESLNFKASIISTPAMSIANSLGLEDAAKFILIAPIATTSHKQWPLDKFVRLTQELKNNSQERYDLLLVGTHEQFNLAEEAYKNIGFKVNNLCGRLSIEELAVLFSKAKGYIGNDGGMSQLAGLMGCPSVIIFNSVEEDWVTHPWRSVNGVIKNRTACSPCFNSHYCPEGHNKCMIDISVESVMLKVNQNIVKPKLQIL